MVIPPAAAPRAAAKRGEVDPDLDSDAVARSVIALFHGLVLQRAWYPDMDVDAYRRAARELVTGTLRR